MAAVVAGDPEAGMEPEEVARWQWHGTAPCVASHFTWLSCQLCIDWLTWTTTTDGRELAFPFFFSGRVCGCLAGVVDRCGLATTEPGTGNMAMMTCVERDGEWTGHRPS